MKIKSAPYPRIKIQQVANLPETMGYRAFRRADYLTVQRVFVSAFSDSEGAEEGQRIGQLVKELVDGTDTQDLCGFVATDGNIITGAIFFSRLTFIEKEKSSFLLSPVAVLPEYQRKGIGQSLIRFGLDQLRTDGVVFVATYGSPLYYSKVGFTPLSHDIIRPPFKLSQPHGWIGQSLNDEPLSEFISGPCTCVAAFNNPEYW